MYRAVERLGQRLAGQLRSERAFSAHAAHSLRTPVAGVTAQVELLLKRAPEELRPKLQLVLEAMRRLAGVIEALLTMARSGRVPHMREFPASALDAFGQLQVEALDAAHAARMAQAQHHRHAQGRHHAGERWLIGTVIVFGEMYRQLPWQIRQSHVGVCVVQQVEGC